MPALIFLQDVTKIIEGIEKIAEKTGIDPKLLRFVWWALVALLLIWVLTWLKTLLWEKYIRPLRATPEEKRRLAHRQMFAGVIEGKIRDINSNEEWRDHRFAELEAEVEADGERRSLSLNPLRKRTRRGLWREKSLTKAIEMSRDRLIQLEGEPGSGKSVALRFVARTLAERAINSRRLKSVIPLYLNLKGLSRKPGEAVDQSFIKSFVLRTLNSANDRDVERFLEDEFSRGMEEGTWLFLFDSFDEIPEVLSSTETDEVIKSYAGAISDFLSGMNRCRGVVASRHFRNPGQSRWPRFRILPLSEPRRLKLIGRALLPPEVESQLVGHLAMAAPEIRDMASSPMLLGLLTDYMKNGNAFPDNVHTILSSYLEHRLSRDKERVERRYGVRVSAARAAAEGAAFCMAADAGLGLSPSRASLKRAMIEQGFEFEEDVDKLLDSLLFIKLARSEEPSPSAPQSFTFAHRRFQEYFATRVVLREPERVGPQALLRDARWRETTAVMCQSQSSEILAPLLEEVRRVLAEIEEGFRFTPGEEHSADSPSAEDDDERPEEALRPESVVWPYRAIYVLNLLQDGFSRRLEVLPEDIRHRIGRMLLTVDRKAGRPDRKRVLELMGTAPAPAKLKILRRAFKDNSQLLKNIAYWQVARLGEIPQDIADSIRVALLRLLGTGRLRRERLATRAHLMRLDKNNQFISSLSLLLALPHVDMLLHALAILNVVLLTTSAGLVTYRLLLFTCSLISISHLSFRLLHFIQIPFGKSLGLAVAAFLRFMVAFMMYVLPEVIFARAAHGLTWFWVSRILSIYLGLWLPSALLAVRVGQFTSVSWWPLMPIVPVLLLITNAQARLETVWTHIKKHVLQEAAFLSFYVLLVYLVLVREVMFPVYVLSILGFISLLVMSSPLAFNWLRDKIRWQMKARAYSPDMTGKFFREEFYKYRSNSVRHRFVSAVRSGGLLQATGQTDVLLEELILSAERKVIELKAEIKNRGFLRALMHPSELFSTLSADVIDELTLLLEQVRSNRRDYRAQDEVSLPTSAATGSDARSDKSATSASPLGFGRLDD